MQRQMQMWLLFVDFWLILFLIGSGQREKTPDRLVSCKLRQTAQSQHQQNNTHRAHAP